MRDTYLDNPTSVERWVTNLTDRDAKLFDQGVAFALQIVREDLTDAKIKLYLKLMDIKGDVEFENQLLARIHSIETAQQSLIKRLESIDSPI